MSIVLRLRVVLSLPSRKRIKKGGDGGGTRIVWVRSVTFNRVTWRMVRHVEVKWMAWTVRSCLCILSLVFLNSCSRPGPANNENPSSLLSLFTAGRIPTQYHPSPFPFPFVTRTRWIQFTDTFRFVGGDKAVPLYFPDRKQWYNEEMLGGCVNNTNTQKEKKDLKTYPFVLNNSIKL